jgi:predicted MFS family arabinose efflux permease
MNLRRNKGFVLLWCGQFLSFLGDWALRTMLLIWVYQLTRSGIAVSVVGVAEAMPLLVLAPLAGVFVDRWHRAYTMAGAVLARAVLVLPLLTVTTRADFGVILGVTVLANCASQFFMPAASAAVPVVVKQEQVGQANSLLSLGSGGITVIAPGAAALLFAGAGPHGAVGALAALYVLATLVLLFVPAGRSVGKGQEPPSVLREMRAGLRYVRRSSLLVALLAMAFVAMLGVGALSVLDVVFVTRALHLRSETVGLLLTVNGVGILTGGIVLSLLSARLTRSYHWLLGGACIVVGLGYVAYALAPTLLAAAIVLFVVGLALPPLSVSAMTMVQLVTEDAFMGRVMSLLNTSMAVATLASLACGGVLTDLFGVRQVIAGGAVLLTAAGLLSLLLIRTTPTRQRGLAEDAAATPVPAPVDMTS